MPYRAHLLRFKTIEIMNSNPKNKYFNKYISIEFEQIFSASLQPDFPKDRYIQHIHRHYLQRFVSIIVYPQYLVPKDQYLLM